MDSTLSLFPLGWQHYLLGGLFIGAGVALLFVFTGLVGGMSSVFSSTWSYLLRQPYFQQARYTGSRGRRPGPPAGPGLRAPVWAVVVGGFLVGYGARLGNGCTSGHGICGLGSLQWPSLLAVLTFMATAFITANLAAGWMA